MGDPRAASDAKVDPLVSVLGATIKTYRIRRVPLDELRRAFAKHDPTGVTSSDARQRIADALEVLASGGSVTMPKQQKSYESHASPRLPKWVERTSVSRAKVALPTRTWRPELAAAASAARTIIEFDVLSAIDGFLRDGGAARPRVPHRERSLQLFGDEKRLDALLRTKLFTGGFLTLDLLRCFQAPLPFAMQYVGELGQAPDLLIVENHATYASALSVARTRVRGGGEGIGVGYGVGNQFPNAVDGVTQLDPLPGRIWYFGDLDVDGLRIAERAASAARLLSLPRLRPALPLYREMIDSGRTQPSARRCDEAAAWAATEWLEEPQMRQQAAGVLAGGERIAQETVGLEVLSRIDRWW